ncbi:hypothetical protein K435DRAFT_858426 [Dendrothele bispora CBS 962.96]|uniref:Uncharacterized protein n=1 Tax=Dendrothele bispora (strain CBS 962.96) TaxID=1314807 RepID=A0A4S8M346_DENBC|nr:hypothetical protein K435DRAFT_858426 [Dendrothele bispora CBS 962.96]
MSPVILENPFDVPVSGKTTQSVHLKLAEEASRKARRELNIEEGLQDADSEEEELPDLDTTPGEFLFFSLEVEQWQ